MIKNIYFLISVNLLLIISCGWQNIARSGSLVDDLNSMQLLYYDDILDEASGDTPPLITSSWNRHWVSILRTLKAENSDINLKLANYIVYERRKRGLPELIY